MGLANREMGLANREMGLANREMGLANWEMGMSWESFDCLCFSSSLSVYSGEDSLQEADVDECGHQSGHAD